LQLRFLLQTLQEFGFRLLIEIGGFDCGDGSIAVCFFQRLLLGICF